MYPGAAGYLRTGLRATGIIPAGESQYNLFSNYDNSKQLTLSNLTDEINERYGNGKLRIVTEGYDKNWKMKQVYLSKQYTTNWQDIIVTK